jgi:hypothetical protein
VCVCVAWESGLDETVTALLYYGYIRREENTCQTACMRRVAFIYSVYRLYDEVECCMLFGYHHEMYSEGSILLKNIMLNQVWRATERASHLSTSPKLC